MGLAGGFDPVSSFVSQPAPLADVSTVQIEAICQKYKLGDDICQLFVAKALHPLDCLFEIKDDLKLEDMNNGYTFAYIADIKLAVKKMLSETDSMVRVITSKEENETSADGTQPPIFDFKCDLSTVVGGKGDRVVDGVHLPFCMGSRGGSAGVQTLFGTEGTGSEACQEEDVENGTLNEAPQTPGLYVALIARNFGGRGMGSEGCPGQDGESPDFACLLFSFHGEPRRPLLFKTLLPSHLPTNIRQLLQNKGFQSVGGLLEAYDTDMRIESFESGQIRGLTVALSKVATRRETLVKSTN
ncbi:hypothetical protein C8R45DRAFT_1138928 [Mycena sanguinolenta]|nr:hypothetical protein C8R45DRAFT_1138928 [Mycena sanguinolenta]